MCIIAAVPQGRILDQDTISKCWENNPDMGGFSYVDQADRVVIRKFKKLDHFQKEYQVLSNMYADSTPFLLHFRIKTHGGITKENCHPFRIGPDLVFAHNGIIDIDIPKELDGFSDTFAFNEIILKPLYNQYPDFLSNFAIKELITNYMGNYSKLAFLDSNREITLINEKLGKYHKGIWYSNNTFKQCAISYTKPKKSYSENDFINWFEDDNTPWHNLSFQSYSHCEYCLNDMTDDETVFIENHDAMICNSCFELYKDDLNLV